MIPCVIVDTNVVVSGLLSREARSPTSRILAGMWWGKLEFVLSEALLDEYRRVLLRPRVRRCHGLSEEEIAQFLAVLRLRCRFRDPPKGPHLAPDRKDQHLWDLMDDDASLVLITGDAAIRLPEGNPYAGRILAPSEFVARYAGYWESG